MDDGETFINPEHLFSLKSVPAEMVPKLVTKFRECNSVQETADAFSVDWKIVADIIFLDSYGAR